MKRKQEAIKDRKNIEVFFSHDVKIANCHEIKLLFCEYNFNTSVVFEP